MPTKKPAKPKLKRAVASKKKRTSKGVRGQGASFGKRVGRVVVGLVVGALLGCVVVVGALYRQAVGDVDRVLAGPVWSTTGRVTSAPLAVWPGLALTAEALADDLQGAGYARVGQLQKDGDFVVTDQELVVMDGAAKGGRITVGFASGKVASVKPSRRASFRPTELAHLGGSDGETRHPITLQDVPAHLKEAVLAVEDARFYEHEGIDPLGVLRAIVTNMVAGEMRQGGSTLTQQLVKNLFLTQERSLERKGREAILALALEERIPKDRILELYLNEIYLGQHAGSAVCGMDEAARTYFGKPASRLSLEEAATLAGIVAGPNLYSPVRHPDRAQKRRDVVLDRMVEVGFLDAKEGAAAKAQPLVVHATESRRKSPWAVDMALEKAEEELGAGVVAAQGLKVQTTIEPALQRLAETVVRESLAELATKHPTLAGAEMALVALSAEDGSVVALVGGHDYATTPFDRATHGHRQVGSTVKLLTALVAFESDPGLSPGTRLLDEPIERFVDGERWAPENYDGVYEGPVSLRRAVAESRNVPSVLLAEQVGMEKLRRDWKALGLSGATALPSSALGAFEATPLELAGAYTVFPGNGVVRTPQVVRVVTDADGVTVWTEEPTSERVASEGAAFLATDLGVEVIESGTGALAKKYGVTQGAGGKTGTTDRGHDAWFAGYTKELVVVVWVGFDQGRPLGLSGASAALPAWSRFVAGSGTAKGTFDPPAGLVEVEVCSESGERATERCPEVGPEWFREGYVPEDPCPTHSGIVTNATELAEDVVEDAVHGIKGLFKKRER